MTTTRDLMTPSPRCIGVNDSLRIAASVMADLGVGALPICGEDKRLKGMVTDRDIVVKCVAAGDDPAARRVGELAQGRAITIGVDDSVEDALHTMMNADVRRLPVIDGHTLVGMVSLADLAMSLPDEDIGEFVGTVSAAPPNN
jgi:CBS domain-containing protein